MAWHGRDFVFRTCYIPLADKHISKSLPTDPREFFRVPWPFYYFFNVRQPLFIKVKDVAYICTLLLKIILQCYINYTKWIQNTVMWDTEFAEPDC